MGIDKDQKKFRLPRKIKDKIPKGVYCYSILNIDLNQHKGFKVKPCSFYDTVQVKEQAEHFSQYNDEDDDGSGSGSEDFVSEFGESFVGWCKLEKTEIDDQCKLCGIKDGF